MAKKITKQQLIHSLIKHYGNYSAVANEFDMDRSSIKQRVDRNPDIRDAVDTAINTFGDEVEKIVRDEALRGGVKTAIFLLKTKFKDRGYTEKQELEHSGAMTVETTLDIIDRIDSME